MGAMLFPSPPRKSIAGMARSYMPPHSRRSAPWARCFFHHPAQEHRGHGPLLRASTQP